uniref:Low-density lipoprotein receptor domain class A n=1 Tax=Panagrellus redivivus TaxID=6233 RepID=A0A7E4V3S5_PANRE
MPDEHAPMSMSSSSMSRLNRVMGLLCILMAIMVMFVSMPTASAQDLYGAQYGYANQPDEARPRVRHLQEADDLGYGPGPAAVPGQDPESNCGGQFQWMCDNGQCIARYDRCDGFLQCEDGSDEKNCRGRFAPHEGNNPHPVKHPAPAATTKPPASTNATTIPVPSKPESESLLLPLKFVLGGAAALILVAGLVNFIVKRRQALRSNIRNYRKGQSLVDDEDDLLISQMYS